ncbi:MAG: S49 family peptidase [Phycisphaerae bacterium]
MPAGPPPWWMHPPKKRSWILRIFVMMGVGVFLLSVLLNIYLLAAVSMASDATKMVSSVADKGNDDEVVAVYRMVGLIDANAAGNFKKFAGTAAEDPNIKAVVLRVDSPGGTVTASDQIHKMVEDLRGQGKVVVVSMGGVAASGGYYVSAPADEIVAEPTTLTGSIGVIMNWWVVEGTLEKIGVEAVSMKSSRAQGWKDEISPFRTPDQRQKKHLQGVLDKMQAQFEKVVRDGRGRRLKTQQNTFDMENGEGQTVTVTETAPLNGKIYLAEEAKQHGLIDKIGYEETAWARAEALAGLVDAKVVVYSHRRPLLDSLLYGKTNTGLGIDQETIDSLQTPKVMMLWRAE